jgi:hypothetical protein
MRRAQVFLVTVGSVLVALTGTAAATPKVTLRAEVVPIPGYPHTGLIYGAGAAVKGEFKITGTEYENSPPPLKQVTVYLPTGVKLHPAGFPTCPKADLEPAGPGPSACPKGSAAGPVGEAEGFVTLGGERVKERATIESFYAPGGGLEFFTAGHTPVSLEILSAGHYKNLGGGGGFGPVFVAEVPLVPSLPGAPFVSVEKIKVQEGSAIGPKDPKKAIYYGRVPGRKQCPKHYFLAKAVLAFWAVGGLPEQTVTVMYHARCPRH